MVQASFTARFVIIVAATIVTALIARNNYHVVKLSTNKSSIN